MVANLALLLNGLFILSALAAFEGTLTLYRAWPVSC